MENDGKMSVERSLEIISNAIELGRRDVERNAGTPMIMWGVLTCITGGIVCLLWRLTGTAVWNMLWFAMCVVGWVIQVLMNRRERNESRPSSYVWKLVGWTWTVFGILAGGCRNWDVVKRCVGLWHAPAHHGRYHTAAYVRLGSDGLRDEGQDVWRPHRWQRHLGELRPVVSRSL